MNGVQEKFYVFNASQNDNEIITTGIQSCENFGL